MILDADGQVLCVRDRVQHLPTGKLGTIRRIIRTQAGIRWDDRTYERDEYVSKTLPGSLRKVKNDDQQPAQGQDPRPAPDAVDDHRNRRRVVRRR